MHRNSNLSYDERRKQIRLIEIGREDIKKSKVAEVLGHLEDAQKHIDSAIRNFQDGNPDLLDISVDLGRAYHYKSHLDQAQGNLDAAQRDINLSILALIMTYNPSDMNACIDLGVVYHDQSKLDQAQNMGKRANMNLNFAILYLNQACEVAPMSAVPFYNRACAYLDKYNFERDQSNLEELQMYFTRAINDCSSALLSDPSLALAYHNRASAYLGKSKLTQDEGEAQYYINLAISDCSEALARNSSLAVAYHNRSSAYLAQGDYVRALSDFIEARELDPTNESKFEYQNTLEKMFDAIKEGRIKEGDLDGMDKYKIFAAIKLLDDKDLQKKLLGPCLDEKSDTVLNKCFRKKRGIRACREGKGILKDIRDHLRGLDLKRAELAAAGPAPAAAATVTTAAGLAYEESVYKKDHTLFSANKNDVGLVPRNPSGDDNNPILNDETYFRI